MDFEAAVFVDLQGEHLPAIPTERIRYLVFVDLQGEHSHTAPLSAREIRAGVPANEEEFCRIYGPRIRKQISTYRSVSRDDIDDLKQTMLLQFLAGNYLYIYDADKQSVYAEKRYSREKARFDSGEIDQAPTRHEGKFSSFVYEFVSVRMRGISERAVRDTIRERSLDSFFDPEDGSEDGDTSLSVFWGREDSEYMNIEVRQILQKAYVHLVEVTSPTSTRNFPELFLQAVNDSFTNGTIDREAQANRKGMTVSAVAMQLKDLRSHLEQSGFKRQLLEQIFNRDRLANSASLL